MTEHVQAFDYHRDSQGILQFGLCDSKSDEIIMEAVKGNTSIAGGAIGFLQKAWINGAPDALILDGILIGRLQSFRRFLAGKGVKLRMLSLFDRELRRKLERAFKSPTGCKPVPPSQV